MAATDNQMHKADLSPQILGDKETLKESTLNLASLTKAAAESVVQVCGTDTEDKRYRDCGTGFIVEKDGAKYVITNDHVVKSLKSFNISSASGALLHGDAVASDPANDLAAIRLTGRIPEGLKALAVGSTQSVFRGTEMAGIGYAMGQHRLAISPGILGNKALLRDIQPNLKKPLSPMADLNRIQLDSEMLTHEGESGGPLLDKQNKVVGIITYTDNFGSSVAATAEELLNFLSKATFKPLARSK